MKEKSMYFYGPPQKTLNSYKTFKKYLLEILSKEKKS